MSITAWQASSWSAATMTPLPAASPLAFTTRAGKSALLTHFNRWARLNRCRIERFYCRTMFVKLNGGCLSTAAALWLLSPSKCSTLSVSVARMRHNHHIFTSLTPSSIPESKLLTISFPIMAPRLCLMAPKPNIFIEKLQFNHSRTNIVKRGSFCCNCRFCVYWRADEVASLLGVSEGAVTGRWNAVTHHKGLWVTFAGLKLRRLGWRPKTCDSSRRQVIHNS